MLFCLLADWLRGLGLTLRGFAAGTTLSSYQVDNCSDDTHRVPEGRVVQESQGRNLLEDGVVFHPEESDQAEQGQELDRPALADDHQSRSGEETDDDQSEIFFEVGSNGFTAGAASDGLAQIFIELISLFFILIEQPGLEEDSCNNQNKGNG